MSVAPTDPASDDAVLPEPGAMARLARALEREKRAREDAERAVSLNDLFVAILGHDLRNPLGAILVGAQHLERIATTEAQLRNASRIVSSAERMARMIDQLLDFTRIRAGQGLTMDLGPVHLSELCARTVEELEAAHPTRVVECRYEGDVVGVWDADRLLQVLSNLVANALRHGAGSAPVELRIDGTRAGSVTITVANDGMIPEDLLPNVFDPFRRDDRRDERRSDGLGLGLYITRQIVEAHGGTIDVTSAHESGTRFTIVLPRHPTRGLTTASVRSP
ncbi:HAMP domain-containing histidine kinase [Myxococcota bacterium]|nr:HAMP domain-containing histidine kinase [Myxococcota bacterium]